MTTRKVLEDARDLIDEPGKWCQNLLYDCDSGAHCALGAIKRSSGLSAFFLSEINDEFVSAANKVAQVIKPNGYTIDTVARYNNTHDHACIIEAFDAAIERCSD